MRVLSSDNLLLPELNSMIVLRSNSSWSGPKSGTGDTARYPLARNEWHSPKRNKATNASRICLTADEADATSATCSFRPFHFWTLPRHDAIENTTTSSMALINWK